MKRIIFLLAILLLISPLYLTATNFDGDLVSEGLNDFTFALIQTAPNTVSHQNMWADAYIGQLFAVPPHFGGGISTGAAQLDSTGLVKVFQEALGLDFFTAETIYLPTLTLDARIGGIGFPFDLGVHGMIISQPIELSALGQAFEVDYGTIGIDIRIPLIKQNVILPNLSIGAGFAYSKGQVGISNSLAEISAGYESCILQASVQVSKKILILTPFAGIRGTLSSSKRNWKWSYSFDSGDTLNGYAVDISDEHSYSDPEWSSFEFNKDDPNYTAQIYAGVGFNILFVAQISLNASFDIVNQIWAGGLSVRAAL